MEQIEKDKLLKKSRLIYSGELALFTLIFLVVATLKITGLINTDPLRTSIIAIITTLGTSWLITDFIWTLISKKRREKHPLLDKCLALPLALYVLTFNILCFINWNNRLEWDLAFYRVGFSIILYYGALIYLFQAIYYLNHMHPLILEAFNQEVAEIEKEEEEEKAKLLKEKEESKDKMEQ